LLIHLDVISNGRFSESNPQNQLLTLMTLVLNSFMAVVFTKTSTFQIGIDMAANVSRKPPSLKD